MKNHTIKITLLLLLPAAAISQIYDVPAYLKLEKADDYRHYENNVINCVGWLENTPVNDMKEKRAKANKFIFDWITGAPNVMIGVHSFVTNFCEKNPELMMSFMGGWTRYVLQTKDTAEVKGNLAGIQSVIKVYKSNRNVLKKDKKVEELIKVSDEGKLEDWIKEQLAKKE